MGNSKTITVQTENGPVVVKKLALGEYSELLRALKVFPQELGGFLAQTDNEKLQSMSMGEYLAAALQIASEHLEEAADVMAVCSDKDSKFFLEGDLADGLEVFAAALELNDYSRIITAVKKIMAGKQPQDHLPPKVEAQTPTST